MQIILITVIIMAISGFTYKGDKVKKERENLK